jgi:hypothetical protein
VGFSAHLDDPIRIWVYPDVDKTAVASDLSGHDFSLVDADTGKIVLTGPIKQQKTQLGSYQLLDFSEVKQPGNYLLRSGETSTRPFELVTMPGAKVF